MKRDNAITSLSTIKARNLMRGLISNKDPGHTMRALEKIRNEHSEFDFRQALLILRGNDIFSQNVIGRDFNRRFPKLAGKGATTTFLPENIISKISRNSIKLAELLNIVANILRDISHKDYKSAIGNCRNLIDSNGASIAALRYLQFIKNHTSETQDLTKEIEKILDDASASNVRYVSSVMRELSSARTDYFNISDRVSKAELNAGVIIARTFLDVIPRSFEEFSFALSSLYCVSLFDAFLYLARLQKVSLEFVPKISEELAAAYALCNQPIRALDDLYESSDVGFGLYFFKEAFLLLEVDDVFKYRTVHSALFNIVERKEDRRTPFERSLLADYFSPVENISELGTVPPFQKICLHQYSADEACHFQKSTALVYFLERSDGDIGGRENDFVALMSRTMAIGAICPQQYIESIKEKSNSSELKIVAVALSHIKQRTQLKEHELRSILQEAATSKFEGNYTKLLEHIYDISISVAEHLVLTSDETFLSKLFQIMPNPNAAIQERANILEWYGSKTGDSTIIDRAKNLRIDVQINKERGTIDDSRIYVDPVKFTQWINNQVLDRFAILLDSLPQTVEPLIAPVAWDNVKTGIDPYEQLASLILECYEEFCSNKVYGIASYLGRRIRHGTLKGTGYNDVAALHKQPRFSNLFDSLEFNKAYSDWLENYAKALDELRDKYLYIQNKNKPDGLIFLDFRSTPKKLVATHLLHDILKSFALTKSCVEIPYLIMEYCWRIIGEDLSSIRKLVMEKKSQYGVFRVPHSLAYQCKQRDLQQFCQELNSAAAERFRTIELWFQKPSIASPSADITLLFKAVVSEIKSQFPEFLPKVIVDEQGFMLDGGAYHVIYDALFILIYNVAENGDPIGELKMILELKELGGRKQVDINIFSQINRSQNMDCVEKSIISALQEDCEDAMVIEGRSGIKKLRGMEQAGYIKDVAYGFKDKTVRASFSFGLNY